MGICSYLLAYLEICPLGPSFGAVNKVMLQFDVLFIGEKLKD